MPTLVLTDLQKCDLSVTFVDSLGNPVTLPAAPVWAVSDATVLAITPSTDGLSASVSAAGKTGSAQVSVTGTNADGTPVVGTLDVQVTASDAVSANIAAGTPTAK